MTLLILYVVLAIGFSFLCSVMEAVLLSVTPTFVAQIEVQRPLLGKRLRILKDDVDRPLAAILSLNTIAHTVGAVGVGAQAAEVYGEASIGVVSGVMTVLILVVSEIIPKTLGAVYWRALTPSVIHLLVPTIWSMWPLVWLSKGITRLLARGKKRILISREELTAMADLGAQEGVVHEEESRILKNLFRLGQLRVRDIMTPRTVILALPADQTVSEALLANPEIRFSRLPVFGANRDDIQGFVLKTDLLLHAADQRGETPLGDLVRPLPAVPVDLHLRGLFEQLMENQGHIALAVDEYGGTAGLVTLEDLVETLLGLEIVDEADAVQDMQELARRKWRERASKLGLEIEEDVPTAGNP